MQNDVICGIILWVVFVFASRMAGSRKGKAGTGLVLGLFLGPAGLLMALFLRPDKKQLEKEDIALGEAKRCPACCELVQPGASICRYCGHAFEVDEIKCQQQTENTQKKDKRFGGLNDQLFS